jgi:hypothetical protein
MRSTFTVYLTAPDERIAVVRARYFFVDESIDDWAAQSLDWEVVSIEDADDDIRAQLSAQAWPDWATTQMDAACYAQSDWDAATWAEERGADV